MENAQYKKSKQPIQRISPSDSELESNILGYLLNYPDAWLDVMTSHNPFFDIQHSNIFEAFTVTYNETLGRMDLMLVVKKLRQMGVTTLQGGSVNLAILPSLTSEGGTLNRETFISKFLYLMELYIRRKLYKVCVEVEKNAYDSTEDIFTTVNNAVKEIESIASPLVTSTENKVGDIAADIYKKVIYLSNNPGTLPGIPTGFFELDKKLLGMKKQDLIIIAARPAMGKTALALQIAQNSAKLEESRVGIFSLEMSKEQLIKRMISSESSITGEKIMTGNLSEKEKNTLSETVGKISNLPIYIEDTPALSIFELKGKAREMKKKYNINLIIVDYLQLLVAEKDQKNKNFGNRTQEVDAISRGLKALAKELDLTIIALSQLSRSVESRTDKRPMLSDLRESGNIEADADKVMFIYRPEYYGIKQDETGHSTQNIAEIIIAKNRESSTGNLSLWFEGMFTRFSDIKYDRQSIDTPF